jgi:multidrug efflux pump subunit AcrB
VDAAGRAAAVDLPTINVSSDLPGASAKVMATAVATPLERQIALIPGVVDMTSTLLGNTDPGTGHSAVHRGPFLAIPKGFFPQQDTGQIVGSSEAPTDISAPAMAARQQALVMRVMKDPAVDNVYSWIDPSPLNQGRLVVNLKPFDQRSDDAGLVMARLRKAVAVVPGIVNLSLPRPPGRRNHTPLQRSGLELVSSHRPCAKTWHSDTTACGNQLTLR